LAYVAPVEGVARPHVVVGAVLLHAVEDVVLPHAVEDVALPHVVEGEVPPHAVAGVPLVGRAVDEYVVVPVGLALARAAVAPLYGP
jgi:hypothetical protein